MPRHIVITGASNGIGRALALAYAGPGITLALTGRNTERLEDVATACRKRGADVGIRALDVREEEQVQDWLAELDARLPIDLLIANAGVLHTPPRGAVTESAGTLRETFEVNLLATIATVNPVLDRMLARRHGSIAIISSLSALHAIPVFPAYAASKAALRAYYDAIRIRAHSSGVHICVVCPGYIRTDMTRDLQIADHLIIDADVAAERIRDGIAQRRRSIVFPWTLAAGLYLLQWLPPAIADRILAAMYPQASS